MIGVTVAAALSVLGIVAYIVSCYRWDHRDDRSGR